jgi:hypothetical protein
MLQIQTYLVNFIILPFCSCNVIATQTNFKPNQTLKKEDRKIILKNYFSVALFINVTLAYFLYFPVPTLP